MQDSRKGLSYKLFLFFVLSCPLLSIGSLKAQELISFPDIPGRNPSEHYECRVRQVGSDEWHDAFVLQTISKAPAEDNGYTQILDGWTASWISLEFNGTAVEVEITKIDGGVINKAMVRPVGHASAAEIRDGKAYIIFDSPANVNVDINGQMEDQYTGMGYEGPPVHTISIFANPIFHKPDTTNSRVYALNPGEAIPDRDSWDTLYFNPGVHNIGVPYTILSDETLYIPGDAVVHGTIHPPDEWGNAAAKNISVYGSGALSGENIEKTKDPSTRPIDNQASNARFEGFVIVDPAYHSVTFNTAIDNAAYSNLFRNIKILGWRTNGDGIHAFRHAEIVDCFIRTQDDSFYYSGDVKIHKCVVWNDFNGAVIRIIKGDDTPETSCFKDITVIYHRAFWHYWSGGRVISFRDAGPGNTINNVLVQNVLVEDPFPAFPPFYLTMNETGDGTQHMNNVLIEDVIQDYPGVSSSLDASRGKPRNTMLGFNENNKFSNITFKNCSYNGIRLGSFEDGEFLINPYVENIHFILDSVMHPISLTVNDETGGRVSGAGSYTQGDTISVWAIADEGYEFVCWTLNGDTVSLDPQYTFEVLEDLNLTAYFSPLTLTDMGFSDGFRIFPNPTKDLLYFNQDIKKITLLDLTGKEVYSNTKVNQNEGIDLSALESGLFIIQIYKADDIITAKIIVN